MYINTYRHIYTDTMKIDTQTHFIDSQMHIHIEKYKDTDRCMELEQWCKR